MKNRTLLENKSFLEHLGLWDTVRELKVDRVDITIRHGELPTLTMEMPVTLPTKEQPFNLYEACVEAMVKVLYPMDPRLARPKAVELLAKHGVHHG